MRILDDFHKAKILVVGDVMLDRYWWGSVNRISPEAPVPVVSMQNDTYAPGGAANVAVNIAGLGAQAYLIGTVGNDQEGELLKKALNDFNVSPELLIALPQRKTTVKTRIIAHNQQVVRIDREEMSELTDSDERSIRAAVENILPEVSLVVISDYAKGLLTRGFLSFLIERSRSEGKKVLVDPKGKDFSKYAGASIITPNRNEAAAACALDDHLTDVVNLAGQRLISDLNLDSVLITESENGMTLFQKNSAPLHFDAHTQEIYDVTGAGDTVVATLATALASGAEMVTAANLANLAAASAVERIGTTIVTLDMIKSRLYGQDFSLAHP